MTSAAILCHEGRGCVQAPAASSLGRSPLGHPTWGALSSRGAGVCARDPRRRGGMMAGTGARNDRRDRARANPWKLGAAALVAVAVLGLAGTMFVRPFARGSAAPDDATVVSISMSGWSQ